MSKLSEQVLEVLQSAFPQIKIRKEHFVVYHGQKLFLDLFVPQLGLVVEIHGTQHDKFVEHFHGDVEGFRSSKRRDSIKEEWAAGEGYTFLVLRAHQLPITKEALLEMIYEATRVND